MYQNIAVLHTSQAVPTYLLFFTQYPQPTHIISDFRLKYKIKSKKCLFKPLNKTSKYFKSKSSLVLNTSTQIESKLQKINFGIKSHNQSRTIFKSDIKPKLRQKFVFDFKSYSIGSISILNLEAKHFTSGYLRMKISV